MSKILIVEDEEEIADLEKDYLEISGFNVDVLNDGKNAINQITENDYDLLILDLMLPNTNGFEICKSVREKVDIPIIMVTAKVESIDKIRGLGIGKILQTFGFNFVATSTVVVIAFASSALIGVAFGIFPAYKASKLNPIEALRTD